MVSHKFESFCRCKSSVADNLICQLSVNRVNYPLAFERALWGALLPELPTELLTGYKLSLLCVFFKNVLQVTINEYKLCFVFIHNYWYHI